MSELKVKVTIEGMSVELEGDAENVKEIFASLKESGMGYMNITSQQIETTAAKVIDENEIIDDTFSNEEILEQENIPSLTNVVLSGGPKKEVEWVLVYAFYCSKQGNKFFTKDELRQCYKDTHRHTDNRLKNFATNVKSLITNKYISAVNENDFRIEKTGLELAISIIQGKKVKGSSKKKTPKAKNNVPDTYNWVELDLTQSERDALKKYYAEHPTQNVQEKTIVIAKWLKDVKEIEEVDKDIIFTILRTLNESINFNIYQTLSNAKNRKNYFTSETTGKFKISYIGEDHVDKDLITKG